jgi:hypothetical protein
MQYILYKFQSRVIVNIRKPAHQKSNVTISRLHAKFVISHVRGPNEKRNSNLKIPDPMFENLNLWSIG